MQVRRDGRRPSGGPLPVPASSTAASRCPTPRRTTTYDDVGTPTDSDDAVMGETEEKDNEDGGGTKGACRLFVWRCRRLKAEGETLAGMVSHAPDQLLFAFINYMCGNL